MASALRQAIRYKLTPQEADAIAQRYARFGDREHALAAYYRRRYRQQELGIQNIAHATPDQVFNARQVGALGYGRNDLGLGGPLTVHGAAPTGARSLDPALAMAGTPLPSQQPMADPTTGGVAPPPMGAAPVAAMGGSPLRMAIRDAVTPGYMGDRTVQKPRRRRSLYGGGGGGGG